MGTFKKGDKDGKGNMYYENSNGADSIIAGFWKNDKYVGEYEKPYEVISMSSRVNRVNCSVVDKKGKDITITVHSLFDNTPNNAGYLAISSVSVFQGRYYSMETQKLTNRNVTRMLDVVFPFRAKFTVGAGETEILFNEKAAYDVNIDVQ
jgi:hypothetical protein